MNPPLYKSFHQLILALSEGDLEFAEVLLRHLHKEDLPTAARQLFNALNQKFTLSSEIEIDFERSDFVSALKKPTKPDGLLSSYQDLDLLDGISLVSCCMNRNENLKAPCLHRNCAAQRTIPSFARCTNICCDQFLRIRHWIPRIRETSSMMMNRQYL